MKGSNVTVSHLWKAHIYVIYMLARPTVYLSLPFHSSVLHYFAAVVEGDASVMEGIFAGWAKIFVSNSEDSSPSYSSYYFDDYYDYYRQEYQCVCMCVSLSSSLIVM